MYKVLLTDNIAQAALDVMAEYNDIEAVSVGTLEPAELSKTLPDYEAIIVRSPTKLTADLIAAGTKLKFIGRAGVGVDNIDIDAATKRGIVVMNAPTGNIVSTAEHACALIMSMVRRVPEADRSLRAGRWDRKTLKGTELSGKTLGIIGLGRVGREVSKRMNAFDMNVVAADPYIGADVAASAGAKLVDMDTLLADSDIVTIHVPLGAETRAIIGEPEIAKMRDGAMLVNCARGGIVDEAALEAALSSGKLTAAAVDVFAEEPLGDSPLLRHERCVYTPHLGAATKEAQVRVAVDAARNVANALSKGEINDAVNPAATG